MIRKAAPRACSAMVRRARVIAGEAPTSTPASSAPRSTSGRKRSVSNTLVTPWEMLAMRSRPMPVSMLPLASGVRWPDSSMSYCTNTRFQYSR